MLGKVNVLFREPGQRRHVFLKARIIKIINGNQQHVIAGTEIAITQIAQRVLHRHGFRRALLHQAALVVLRVEQAVFFQKTARRHRIGKRQVGPLHGYRAIEIGVRPDIDQVATDKRNKEEPGNGTRIVAATRQAAQLLPAPGRKQHLQQKNDRHADKHQLPVARHLVLIGVNHQFPDKGIKVQVETGENFAVDQQQRHAHGRQNHRDKAH
ncbi:MAG: hypothetical protein E7D19_15605 [Klebsiella grimontii]|nr:hypothetical protein [Klebsiella grimontii]